MPLRMKIVLTIVTVMLFCFHFITGVIEMVAEQGWQDKEFRLTCRQLMSHIAIMEVQFTPLAAALIHTNITTSALTSALGFDSVRLAVNQRCSGRNHCSFILHADCPGSKLWGPGELFIRYACMPEEQVVRFCNLDIIIPEGGGVSAQGFIMSPGYPKFYVGQSECRWRIKAPSHQRVELSILDVSLSGASGSCEDVLSIVDGGTELYGTCREQREARVLLSESNRIEIVVLGRPGSLVPKRGVLLFYRALECPTPAAPGDGYLVYRNISAAEYRCCIGFVFPDTGLRVRILRCIHNHWDQLLPSHCVNLLNITRIEEIVDRQANMTDNSNLIDIIIPSILIAGLLVGNAIVVFIIYQYRKRKQLDVQEEELNTIVADNSQVP